MSQYANTVMYIVQERLLECRRCAAVIPPWYVDGHELESLILAQNERWRHA